MKKVLSRILLVIILPLLAIGSINYVIDPDYTLNKSYIPQLLSALQKGKMISGPVNVNMRLLKKQWIYQMDSVPDILALGSSRTLNLSSQTFSDNNFYNASVSNCTLQDMYSLLQCFDNRHKSLPPNVIICCDQWLFGNSFTEKRWLENRKEFIQLQIKTGGASQTKIPSRWNLQKEWISELFSVRYLFRSLKYRGKTEKFEICNKIDVSKMMLLDDGSRRIPDQISNTSENEKTKLSKAYFYNSKDEVFKQLDTNQINLFENLLAHLKKRNCNVLLYIPPYHPKTFSILNQNPKTKGILEAEKYIREYASANNFVVMGATNPSSLGFGSFEFYDAVHLNNKALNTLFKAHRKN